MINRTKAIQFSLVNFVIGILIVVFHRGILEYLILHVEQFGIKTMGLLTYLVLFPAFAVLLSVIALAANVIIIKTKDIPGKIISYSALALFVPIVVYYFAWILKYCF